LRGRNNVSEFIKRKINVEKRPVKTKIIIKTIIKSIFTEDLFFFRLISDKNRRKAIKYAIAAPPPNKIKPTSFGKFISLTKF
jgi:hypothetical protein